MRSIVEELEATNATLRGIREELAWLYEGLDQHFEITAVDAACAKCGRHGVTNRDVLCRVCAQLPDVEEADDAET